MQIDKGVLRVGAEIEVPRWKGRTFLDVAKDLLKEGYMLGNDSVWSKVHTYHCSCEEGGCNIVKNGTIVDPPVVSMTYDATLPKTGAEFIVSPLLLASNGMPHLEKIWDIVAKKAEWTVGLKDIKDRPCSPSVHLHVSATLGSPRDRGQGYVEDVLHALSLFSPELFAISDTAGVRRGLTYRLPNRTSILSTPNGLHHGFIQVRQASKGNVVYIEWRLFEAAYNNWPYVEACAYLAAALTRGLLNNDVFQELMSIGYSEVFDEDAMVKAVRYDDAAAISSLVSSKRLSRLRDITVAQLSDDPYAQNIVNSLFAKVNV